MKTHTDRTRETRTVKSISNGGITYTDGWGHVLFDSMKGVVREGDEVVQETKGFGTIAGIMHHGRWLFRKSDEDLEREHEEWKEAWQREKEERLAAERADWQARTVALPDWIRARIERFQKSPEFAVEGWGYELCVAELAVIYAEHGLQDSNDDYSPVEGHPAWDYAAKAGTSGHQHDFAKALARQHLAGVGVGETISALTPLTGDPDYSGGTP